MTAGLYDMPALAHGDCQVFDVGRVEWAEIEQAQVVGGTRSARHSSAPVWGEVMVFSRNALSQCLRRHPPEAEQVTPQRRQPLECSAQQRTAAC